MATGGYLRLFGVRRSRVGQLGPVEDVREFDPNMQAGAFREPEDSAETEVFDRTTGVPIVAPIGRSSELAGAGIGPRGGIQDEILIAVDAMAVGVLNKERNPGIAERKRGRIRRHARDRSGDRLERNCPQVVLRVWGQNRQPAGILQERADLPIAERVGEIPIDLPLGNGIIQRQVREIGLVETGNRLRVLAIEDIVYHAVDGAAAGIGLRADGQRLLPGKIPSEVEAVRIPLGDLCL